MAFLLFFFVSAQLTLDLYLLSKLDKKLGQPKINSQRVKRYASRIGVPSKTIDFYLEARFNNYFALPIIDSFYEHQLKSFYYKDPLNWERLYIK